MARRSSLPQLPKLPELLRWVPWVFASAAIVGLLPFFLIARARETKFDRPRIHLIPDMDAQPKFETQEANPLFADGRAMRPPVAGTVARGELWADEHFYRGLVAGNWATTFPVPVTEAMLRRGKDRYEIYCAPCHGLDGAGNGVVAVRADRLQEGTWTPPLSYHDETVRGRPVGHLFNTISNGIRNMPSYDAQVSPMDRWAIVSYLLALQRSQHARLEDVPADVRTSLP